MSVRYDFVDLQLFLHVVEAGSITAGAERGHLALASASARIRQLEEAFGTPLLARGRRGVQPTPAGHALAQHARTMLQQASRASDELEGFAGGLKGRVRLLCNSVALHEYLPTRLGPFLARHPHVDVDAEERLAEAIVQSLAAGTADVGILAQPVDLVGLESWAFAHDELVLVVPRGHPVTAAGRARRVSIAVADRHGVVGLVEGSALQDQWEAAAARRGQRLRYRMRVPSFEAQCRLVEQGVGVALMPRGAAERLGDPKRVRVLGLLEPLLTRTLVVAVRRLDELPAFARELVAHLRAEA